MNEDLMAIINNYGVLHQLKQMNSEQFELTEAIINYQNSKSEFPHLKTEDLKQHVIEEMADNLVMLKQFQLFFVISDEELQKVMNYKIKRTLGRIVEEEEK